MTGTNISTPQCKLMFKKRFEDYKLLLNVFLGWLRFIRRTFLIFSFFDFTQQQQKIDYIFFVSVSVFFCCYFMFDQYYRANSINTIHISILCCCCLYVLLLGVFFLCCCNSIVEHRIYNKFSLLRKIKKGLQCNKKPTLLTPYCIYII